MKSVVQIILVGQDGRIILQQRDDKPGIVNSGLVSAFGGSMDSGEQPLDAAVREINEETNLHLQPADLELFGQYRKNKAVHGEDRDVYYFVARDIDDKQLQVHEGQGFVIVRNKSDMLNLPTSILIREVLTDYFKTTR